MKTLKEITQYRIKKKYLNFKKTSQADLNVIVKIEDTEKNLQAKWGALFTKQDGNQRFLEGMLLNIAKKRQKILKN